MNKLLLLKWLLDDVARNAVSYYRKPKQSLESSLFELNGRRQISLPKRLPKDEQALLAALQNSFRDDVALISLVLHDRFPDRYIFYRHSQLESEIFDGFVFFSEIEPLFNFSFHSVGKRGLKRYLILNEALLQFADKHWPQKREKRDAYLAYFLYRGLARLFRQKNDYQRYWVVISKEHERLNRARVAWSGRKEMKRGDLVFAYRTAPHSALTDLFRIEDDPIFDPWGGWHGFWVKMKKIAPLPPITLREMKADSTLARWSLVRRQFQGSVEAMPHTIYNRLLQEIPESIRKRHQLHPEVIAQAPQSGEFASEKDFEDRVVEPLLRQWGFSFNRQYLCDFQIGSQVIRGRVDFLVEDQHGPITLFENKFRILGDGDLRKATDQAKSYALQLGTPSFVVASPEGFWLYQLRAHRERLIMQMSLPRPGDGIAEAEAFRRQLLSLRASTRRSSHN